MKRTESVGFLALVAVVVMVFATVASASVAVSVAPETIIASDGFPARGEWIVGGVSSVAGLRSFKVFVDGRPAKVMFYAGNPRERNLNGKWAVRAPRPGRGFKGRHLVETRSVCKDAPKGTRAHIFKGRVERVPPK